MSLKMKSVLVLGFLLISSNTAFAHTFQPYVLGGAFAKPRQFPYSVSLLSQRVNPQGIEWGLFCGSSLISEEFVLTAAHCVHGDVANVKLIFGSTNSEDDTKEPESERVVLNVPPTNIIIHEDYVHMARKNDIALVKLNQKIKFKSSIQPVRLPARSQTRLVGTTSVLTGWGGVENAPHSDQLRYAELLILPDERCQNVYRSYYLSSNICLSGSKKSSCSGDSGGGAVITDKDNQLTIVGIVSYGSIFGCDQGEPSGYTRVTSFLDWIHRHTGIPIKD